MERRIFIKNIGWLSFGISAIPVPLDNSIINFFIEDSGNDESMKKYVLRESAFQQNTNSTIDEAERSVRTMFWLTADPSGKLTNAQKRNAMQSRIVSKEALYKACNFKNTAVNDAVASAYEWTWAGGSLALGLVTPPSAAVALGLFALERAATIPVEWTLEANKEAQWNLCALTVEKYYLANTGEKRFFEKDRLTNVIKIPFKEETQELAAKLPENNPVRKAALAVGQSSPSKEEIYNSLLEQQYSEQERQLSSFEEWSQEIRDSRERQAVAEIFEYQNRERQAGIYLTQQLLTHALGDSELGNKFFTLANSLNTIYSTYKQSGLGNALTLAATANYVGAGLAIASLFQGSSGSNDPHIALFRSIRQLTEIIIKGFTEIQKTQIEILNRLKEISDIIIEQGIVEVSMLRTITTEIQAFRADYDMDQYRSIERNLTDAQFRLNDLFKREDFDIAKEPFKTEYLQLLGEFALYGKDHTSANRMLSGYTSTNNFIIEDHVNKFERMHAFEYMIGTVPVVHRTVAHYIPGFSSQEFERKIPNPNEWARAFYLYYQSIFATGIENAVVKNHIQMFLEKGNLLKTFFEKYTQLDFIKNVGDKHRKLSEELVSELNRRFEAILASEPYYLFEYLLSSVDNSRYLDNITLEAFDANGNHQSQNFIIVDAQSIINPNRIYGYKTQFSIPQALLILKHLEEIEDYPMTTEIFPHPVINFTMSHARLKFKNNPVSISFTNVPYNVAGLRSTFAFGKDVQDLAAVKGGSRRADFGRVLENHNFSNTYWKVYPKGSYQAEPPDKKEIDFIDYFRNEIIHAEKRMRNRLISRLVNRESQIMNELSSLVTQLDSLGYLLSSSLTFMKYKREETFLNSYLDHTNGSHNTLEPQKYPLAFARDTLSKFVEFISKDVYNSYRPQEEDKQQFWLFKNNYDYKEHRVPSMSQLSFSKYHIIKYAEGNVVAELSSGQEGLEKLSSDPKTVSATNYNIMRIINECNTYLGKIYTPT